MQFENHIRNEYNKCDTPDNTVHRIRQGFKRLGLQPEYAGVKVSESLFWGRIWIDSLQIVCEGKGTSRALAEASAHAELTERLSAGLYTTGLDTGVEAGEDDAAVRERADAINRRVAGWAYRVPDYKASTIDKRMADLVQAVADDA